MNCIVWPVYCPKKIDFMSNHAHGFHLRLLKNWSYVLPKFEFFGAVNWPNDAILGGSEWLRDAGYEPSGRAFSILYGEKTGILTVRFQF
jgi:hypothetical protein